MTRATDARQGVLEAIRGRRSVRAYTAETAYLDLTYEFSNFPLCKAQFAKSDASGL